MTKRFDHKYGVAFDQETADRINDFISEGDSRSRRIRQLVWLGLTAERVFLDNNWYPPSQDTREEMVRNALEEYVDRELD